jgi:sigma-B regulation protein RsbU (phosphoserine phosphatase)
VETGDLLALSTSASSTYIVPPRLLPDWDADQLAYVIETMREMSRQTDPQVMVRDYGNRVRKLLHTDRFTSLSRRNLQKPAVRITRSSLNESEVDPWVQPEKLPMLPGGLLSELIWGDEPVLINDFHADPADPGFRYLDGLRSLLAIPLYDQGMALNMVVLGRNIPDGFEPEALPQHVWMSNLFGRATNNLVLSREVQKAYDALDREMKSVADIQQSLLPAELPTIPTLKMAVHYQTSKRAGGDYYDFFPLPDGRWGILVADVSGHGTPAAVIMAVTHSIAHSHFGIPDPPGKLLSWINHKLAVRYTGGKGTFVTAFYGIYDPADRSLTYTSAGHCPPRVGRVRGGTLESLDVPQHLPLGIDPDETYEDQIAYLHPCDVIAVYTDGITEARNPKGEFFGLEALDQSLRSTCGRSADAVLAAALQSLQAFTGPVQPTDDQTLLVGVVQ